MDTTGIDCYKFPQTIVLKAHLFFSMLFDRLSLFMLVMLHTNIIKPLSGNGLFPLNFVVTCIYADSEVLLSPLLQHLTIQKYKKLKCLFL